MCAPAWGWASGPQRLEIDPDASSAASSSGASGSASGGPTSTDPEIVSRHVLGRFQEDPEQVRELIERASAAVEELLAPAPAEGGTG